MGAEYNAPVPNSTIRSFALACCVLLSGCSPATRPAPRDPNAFEVDAKGAPAVVDQALTLDGLGQPIAYVSAVARCGDLLLFADSSGQVRRLDVTTGTTLPSIARDAANMSMGVDCAARSVYLFGPSGRRLQRGQLYVQSFDIDTGVRRRAYPLELMLMPEANATVADGTLVIGGTWMPMPSEGGHRHPPIDKFYSDKKLGIGVTLDSGQVTPWLSPYDPACRAHCAFSTLSRVVGQGPRVWLATQSSSRNVAFYDVSGVVRHRFDIGSPLFIDDGSVLRTLGGEPDVRWSARNSLVKSSEQFAEIIATIHFRTRLPDDYVFGQSTEFDYWLNLHAMDGRKLVSDIKLPGMPIGRDETHIYVTDYGRDGRHGAPDRLKILRIPVKAGTEGFRHQPQEAGEAGRPLRWRGAPSLTMSEVSRPTEGMRVRSLLRPSAPAGRSAGTAAARPAGAPRPATAGGPVPAGPRM